MSNENKNIPEPSIPDWVKILNQYDPTQYQSGKLVKAEEWNTLFAAAVAQGNYHSNTLDLLINTYLPEKWEEISEDMTEFMNSVNASISEIESEVDTANNNASSAVSAANTAVQTANTAKTASESAVTTANSAAATANSAVTIANSAKTTAEAISGIAEDAKDIAEATQDSLTDYYTKIETDTLFSNLIGGAPEEFDTLKEISDWIANDESGTAALINRVSALETDVTSLENITQNLDGRTIPSSYYNANYYRFSGADLRLGTQDTKYIDLDGASGSPKVSVQSITDSYSGENVGSSTLTKDALSFKDSAAIPNTIISIYARTNEQEETYVTGTYTDQQRGLYYESTDGVSQADSRISWRFNDVLTQVSGDYLADIINPTTSTTPNMNKSYVCITDSTDGTYKAGHIYKIGGTFGNWTATDITASGITKTDLEGRIIPENTTTQFIGDTTAGGTSLIFNNQTGNVKKTTINSSGLEMRTSDVPQAVQLSTDQLSHAGGQIAFRNYSQSGGIGILHSSWGGGLGYFRGNSTVNTFNSNNLKYHMDDVSIHLTGDEIEEQLTMPSSVVYGYKHRIYTGQVVQCSETSTSETYVQGHTYLIGGTRGAYTATDITPLQNLSDFVKKPVYEYHPIQSTAWTALSDETPYTYSTTITVSSILDDFSIVELLNNNPVLFATYGFAIADITGSTVTIYSIGQPTEQITLALEVTQ